MSEKKSFKLICTPTTILITYGSDKLNIKKADSPSDFEKGLKLAELGDEENLIKLFFEINERVKKFTKGNFEVKDKKLHLKGSNEPLPNAMSKALMELEKSGSDYMPLIRFWRKLSKSPHDNSKEQLYSFIIHNKIRITEQGDVVLEKGVQQKKNGMPDELVDCHSKTIDHSVGSYVSMPREKVDDNKNSTCSTGLHAAPADYVRNHYAGKILIEIVVNPADIVSVPVDYNSSKVRCCAYRVVGYSPKTPRENQVVSLSEFILNMDPEKTYNSGGASEKDVKISTKSANDVKSEKGATTKVINLGGLSAKAIVALTIRELECPTFGGNAPGKAACIKKATKLFEDAGWTVSVNANATPVSEEVEKEIIAAPEPEVKSVDFDGKTAKEIISQAMLDLGCKKFGGMIPRRANTVKLATELYEEAGWVVK
jgi:hypothetical protein